MARSDVQERPSPVPERLCTVRSGGQRQSDRRVTVGPNAPQLIRLVRHPYALATGRPQRVDGGDWHRERLDHAPLAELVSRDADRWNRARTVNPFKDIDHRPAPRRRPSADAWLSGDGGGLR